MLLTKERDWSFVYAINDAIAAINQESMDNVSLVKPRNIAKKDDKNIRSKSIVSKKEIASVIV
tara:strand:- start:582 stop:770 length:189 start_codon:yes stop_codon:yes gene_type:complete